MQNQSNLISQIDEVKEDGEYIGHLAAIVEFSDDAIISKALDGTIRSWNKSCEKMFGYTAKHAIGKNISIIIPPEYINEEKKVLEKIRNNEIIDHYETVRSNKNGEQFFVSITVSPLKDHTGRIIGVSKIARDITYRKKSEAELINANRESYFENGEKEKLAAELVIANKELAFQNKEKEKRAAELIIANKELAFQNEGKEKRAAELIIANKELAFQNEEKEKKAMELIIANKELVFQNKEKEKRAAELIIANEELAFQNEEKEKRAAELIIANKELAFQNEEKEKKAAELMIANKELVFQNKEKEKRAAELIIANEELAFQNEEKEKRAAELIIANEELAFQNTEKEKRAAELIIANKELAFQNTEKEKRAAELIIANEELAFQNKEKEKRAAELIIANHELIFQNEEKEKRAAELSVANRELKKAQEKTNKANRLYSFISHINKTIYNVKDGQTLFDEACKIAVQHGKFTMAWIGIADRTTRKINLVASSGTSENDLITLSEKTYDINGPTEKILLGLDYFAINDIQKNQEISWKGYALERNFNSVISLPIKKSGEVIGTFDMYSPEMNFFDSEEIKMLEEVASDISFGIEIFEKIKKQKDTAELIVQSENLFRAIIEKGVDMISLIGPAGKIYYSSPSVAIALGYNNEELLKGCVYDFVHPDDLPGLLEQTQLILKNPGSSFFCQQRYRHKNGKWIWCEGSVTNMFHEPGVNALVSNFRDISKQKIVEKQREFDRNNLDALINNPKDMIWSIDKDLKLITSNQHYNEMMKLVTGHTIEKGSNSLEGFAEEKANRYKIYFTRALSGEAFSEIEYISLPFEYWTEISFYPIHDGKKVVGTACHARNITERRLAELERIKITNDLIQRNKDLEQFTYIISHNLRAPVANILGATSRLNYPGLNIKEKDILTNGLSESVTKLDEVVRDLNHILQVKREINEMKEKVIFSKLVNDIKVSIKNLIDSDNIQVNCDFSEMDEFLTIKSYLYSIFYNLISNSIKYSQPQVHGIIKIKSYRVKDSLELTFSDNGMGIDLEKRGDQVFGLYKRFHANTEGKGVGLFMVKTQVEALGGKIGIKSKVNKGTEFKIEFKI